MTVVSPIANETTAARMVMPRPRLGHGSPGEVGNPLALLADQEDQLTAVPFAGRADQSLDFVAVRALQGEGALEAFRRGFVSARGR